MTAPRMSSTRSAKASPIRRPVPASRAKRELILPFRLGKNRSDFLGCEARLVLALDYRQVHEVVLPLHRINFLALLIACRRYDHLHNSHVAGNGLWGESRRSVLQLGTPLRDNATSPSAID